MIDILKTEADLVCISKSACSHWGEICFRYFISISVGVVAPHDHLPDLFVEVHAIEGSTLYYENRDPVQRFYQVFWIKVFLLSKERINAPGIIRCPLKSSKGYTIEEQRNNGILFRFCSIVPIPFS